MSAAAVSAAFASVSESCPEPRIASMMDFDLAAKAAASAAPSASAGSRLERPIVASRLSRMSLA
jgi:hypothetical protein